MIRAVLIDFDGVLTTEKTGSQSTLRSLSHHAGIPEGKLRDAFMPYNRALIAGRVTHADMWKEFCGCLGEAIDIRLLHTAFVETPLDCEMIDLMEDIHRHCKTGLVTDNTADRIEAIFDHHQLYSLFDAAGISAEIGSGKESDAIFRHVLQSLQLDAHECIFIDNAVKNLVIPQQMGMATVLFDDVKRDIKGLRRLLQI